MAGLEQRGGRGAGGTRKSMEGGSLENAEQGPKLGDESRGNPTQGRAD